MSSAEQNVRVVGRYALYQAIAAGGMATVHLGRLLGPVGFSRTVAIKRLHAQFASDPEFVSMFLDEARLAARIRHPNVVPTLDVVATQGELFLVMDYVPGESLGRLGRALRERQQRIPLRVLSAIMSGVLHGLHSAHGAKDEHGKALGIVHRDVSPQNVLVGTDGAARVLDFGVAKAANRAQTTKEGQLKGKLSYMPPEQLRGANVSRQTDIYAAGVMFWELLTGQRPFAGENEGAIVTKILEGSVEAPSAIVARTDRTLLDNATMAQLEALDATVLRSLSMAPEDRFATAREMAIEIERKCPPATSAEVTDWLESVARDVLDSRAAMVAEIESSTSHVTTGDVQSVLSAKATPWPGGNGSGFPSRLLERKRSVTGPTYPIAEGPPVTQPSSISVSAWTGAATKSRKTAVILIATVMMFASLLAVGFIVVRRQEAERAAAGAASPAGLVAPPSDTEPSVGKPPAPTATATATATTTAEPTVEATASATASTASAGTKPPPARPIVNRPIVKPAGEKPPAPPPEDCAIPFWYDAQGVKHYKSQCLGKSR